MRLTHTNALNWLDIKYISNTVINNGGGFAKTKPPPLLLLSNLSLLELHTVGIQWLPSGKL